MPNPYTDETVRLPPLEQHAPPPPPDPPPYGREERYMSLLAVGLVFALTLITVSLFNIFAAMP